MVLRGLAGCLSLLLATSCASTGAPGCSGADVPGEVLIDTSKMFLKREGEVGYADLAYRVMDGGVDGCHVVAASITPDAFDSDILIFIGQRGVVRAVAPNGEPFFHVHGDRGHGLPRAAPFPLVK
jgi:hypothetical protein